MAHDAIALEIGRYVEGHYLPSMVKLVSGVTVTKIYPGPSPSRVLLRTWTSISFDGNRHTRLAGSTRESAFTKRQDDRHIIAQRASDNWDMCVGLFAALWIIER